MSCAICCRIFLSYCISFIILGVYWVAHHAQFQYIRRADQNLLWLNILFLMCVSLVPFSAGMLGQHGDQQLSVLLYGANLILVALTHFATWRYATRLHRLVDEAIELSIEQLGTRLSLIPLAGYIAAMLVSFIHPSLGILFYALIPLPYAFGWIYRIV